MDSVPVQVVVAFGSNLGDSASLIRWAMDRLEDRSSRPLRRSSLWTSSPVDCPPGSPTFTNAVAILIPKDGETPESLLTFLQSVEVEAGRRPKVVHNESRPLDLDLIAWDGEIRQTPRLVLPHPRAQVRRFVLQPLAELDPSYRFPGEETSITESLQRLPPDDLLRVCSDAR
ncbi:MAG: 2-amino-4-hydroxy-6-hydroxymethyldihydropteridine diphosphokinase [Verrucomicrobia bacterium]|jgi:2-amino-4-hydroxy-6-hydroxymethyldihydropteridine diphosphokinase|nr:2-amino-4-hydroxy-6-hydroxymethyldihydropteridine diphosphokinase [Verrucomicrobiota bacterium]